MKEKGLFSETLQNLLRAGRDLSAMFKLCHFMYKILELEAQVGLNYSLRVYFLFLF